MGGSTIFEFHFGVFLTVQNVYITITLMLNESLATKRRVLIIL